MKQILRRIAALGLALLMAAGPVALASEAMGNELHGGSLGLSQGTNLVKQIFWSDTYSDKRIEQYFTYTPNLNVTPTVAYGDKVLTRATLSSMAKTLEAQGQRVVGGMNGDYYVLATGAPLGLVVTNGIMRSSASYRYAVGFRADGTAFIGVPSLTVTATFNGNTLNVSGGVNKVRTEKGGYVLLTEDFSATTQNTSPGVDVILTPVTADVGQSVNVDLDVTNPGETAPTTPVSSVPPTENAPPTESAPPAGNASPTASPEGEGWTLPEGGVPETVVASAPPAEIKGTQIQSDKLVIGGQVTCTVDQVVESAASIPIPAGKMVLSINSKGDSWLLSQLRAMKPGDTVNVNVTTPDARWSQVPQALGAMYKLVTNGVVDKPMDKLATTAWAERTARTAVGIKADGSTVFYTVDGKQPGYSVGATLTQVAMRLKELGCVEAVSLDGGGSTTIGATYPDGATMGVVGKPADGAQRPNSTAIFLTTTLQATGELGSYYLTPSDAMMLSGASLQMSAMALDTAYHKMDSPGQVAYALASGDGTVTPEGVFTAGPTNSVNKVMATYGTATGTATMTVVQKPDKLSLLNEATGVVVTALNLSPGQKIDLKAASSYKGLPLVSQDACYTWTAEPGAGTMDANGVLTAQTVSSSGKVTVSIGDLSVSVPVSIAGHVLAMETFESSLASFTSTGNMTATLERELDHVRYGKQSMRVDYDATADGTAGLAASLTIPAGESYLGLWVYGDGTGNSLTATVADQSGTTSEMILTALDFTGWKHLSVALPVGSASIRTIQLVFGGAEGMQTGTFWLDHFTTSNEQRTDTTPPTVAVTCAGTNLTATVTDDVDRNMPAASVVVTYDGAALASTWDPAAHTLKAVLPASDGKAHRVTVTAVDASGNLGRGSVDIAATTAGVFTDMGGNWAAPYAEYLYNTGVTNSVDPEAIKFAPGRNISRGEFFAMVARWMRLDLTKYKEVSLPFADTDAIPSWAVNEVKAMYSMGILKGSKDAAGILRVSATANISRTEAMTILGRTQARGYAEPGLTFADAERVPLWSLPYVRALVGQGVVTGFENHIQPMNPITRGEVAKLLYSML